MPFSKGSKKPEGSGRKKGQVARQTLLLREFLEANDINLVGQILARIGAKDQATGKDLLGPKEQIDVLTKLLPYVYPRLSQIALSQTTPEEEAVRNMSDEELFSNVRKIVLMQEVKRGKGKADKVFEPVQEAEAADVRRPASPAAALPATAQRQGHPPGRDRADAGGAAGGKTPGPGKPAPAVRRRRGPQGAK